LKNVEVVLTSVAPCSSNIRNRESKYRCAEAILRWGQENVNSIEVQQISSLVNDLPKEVNWDILGSQVSETHKAVSIDLRGI
jgi:hypothetical protein